MFYISSKKPRNVYGITDTTDGVEEFYTKSVILTQLAPVVEILGVKNGNISVVDATQAVVQSDFDVFELTVRKAVQSWTTEQCLDIARTGHFVKKVKDLHEQDLKREVVRNIYPDSVRETVASARKLGNSITQVDVSSPDNVKNALKSGVCIVLQHKTNGILTAFICTGNLSVVDYLYGEYVFDAAYLTKQLYGYTYNLDKVRPRRDVEKVDNPDMLNVFTCSLRFRNDGRYHDSMNMVISSPTYTVNIPKVLGMFKVENPYRQGDTLLTEYKNAPRKDIYNFDLNMYRAVLKGAKQGVNPFWSGAQFMKYIDTDSLTKSVSLDDVVDRYASNFSYMQYLRKIGYSCKELCPVRD